MRQENISVDQLIPIESYLCLHTLDYLLNEFDSEKFKPIWGIDYLGKYLLCDCHHRAARAEILNEKLPINIVETDFEISASPEGFLHRYSNRELMINTYKNVIKPVLSLDEIFTISDLVNHFKIFHISGNKYLVLD